MMRAGSWYLCILGQHRETSACHLAGEIHDPWGLHPPCKQSQTFAPLTRKVVLVGLIGSCQSWLRSCSLEVPISVDTGSIALCLALRV